MGSHYAELDCARDHVLVLLPECTGDPHLVEGVDHSVADYPVHSRFGYDLQTRQSIKEEKLMRSSCTGFVYFATWDHYADEWGYHSFHIGRCEGELFAAASGCLILTSYLMLFICFYISTYKKPVEKNRKQVAAQSAAKEQGAATATGRAAETLKSARSRFGPASMDMVESSKGQWAASAIQRQHD